MAADDATALVLRLEARITDFEKALDKAAGIARKRTKEIEDTFAKVGQTASAQFAGLGSALGGVAPVLGAIGPAGVAAAAGLGALVGAFAGLLGSANRFAEEMGKIKDIASQTGLTTTLVQALADAGAQFAVTEEDMRRALVRLAAEMDKFTRGEGELFQQINRLDPALARQIALAGDFETQLDGLAKALAKAGAAFPAIARAAFGRGGIEIAETLRNIARTGGLQELQAEFRKSGDLIEDTLTKEVVRLKREIDDMSADARRNLESIFSKAFLEAQKRATEQWLEFSRAAKAFSVSGEFKELLGHLLILTSPLGQLIKQFEALSGIKVPGFGPVPPTPAAPAGDATAAKRISEAELALQKEKVAEIEKEIALHRLKLGIINRALETEATGSEDVGRLKDEELATEQKLQEAIKRKADFETAANKRRVDALESAATTAEKQRLKEQETEKAVRERTLTQEEGNRVLTAYKLAIDQAVLSARIALGVAREEEIIQTKLAELNQKRALGLQLTAAEAAKAEAIIRNEARKTAEEQAIRLSKLPQTLRQGMDFTDINKQMDQLFTGMASSFENAIASIVNGTTTMKDAFRNMSQAIIADLTRIILRLTITGPLLKSLGGLDFGGARAAGGPVVAGRGYVVGERGREVFVPRQSGIIVPNAVVRQQQTAAGGAMITNNYAIDARGADAAAVVRIERALAEHDRTFSARVGSVTRRRQVRRTRF